MLKRMILTSLSSMWHSTMCADHCGAHWTTVGVHWNPRSDAPHTRSNHFNQEIETLCNLACPLLIYLCNPWKQFKHSWLIYTCFCCCCCFLLSLLVFFLFITQKKTVDGVDCLDLAEEPWGIFIWFLFQW